MKSRKQIMLWWCRCFIFRNKHFRLYRNIISSAINVLLISSTLYNWRTMKDVWDQIDSITIYRLWNQRDTIIFESIILKKSIHQTKTFFVTSTLDSIALQSISHITFSCSRSKIIFDVRWKMLEIKSIQSSSLDFEINDIRFSLRALFQAEANIKRKISLSFFFYHRCSKFQQFDLVIVKLSTKYDWIRFYRFRLTNRWQFVAFAHNDLITSKWRAINLSHFSQSSRHLLRTNQLSLLYDITFLRQNMTLS